MKKLVALFLVSVQFVAFSAKQLVYDTTSDNFKKPISLVVLDQPVDFILDALAEKAGVNLVQSEETKSKKITLSLKEVPIKDALDLVIRATDLSYQVLENSIIVASPQKIEREIGENVSIFDLQYSDAEKVKAMLADIAKKVQVDPIGNRVIYTASPKKAKEIEKVLLRVDRPLQQVEFTGEITEVSLNNDYRYGIDWDKISSYNTKLREGSYTDWGTWTEEDGDYTFEYDETSYPVRDIGGNLTDIDAIGDRPSKYASQTSSLFASPWHRIIGQTYDLKLDFKLSDSDAKVLAKPILTTLNNSEAYIHIGDRVPYVISTVEAGNTKQSVQKEEVGVKLKIKPIINEENDITVKVEVEVSTIIGWKGPNAEIPWVKVRRAETTVRVKDGENINIGGMRSETNTTTQDKLPLLGQIPYVGKLFTHEVSTTSNTDLIIKLTPKIKFGGDSDAEGSGEDEF